jgi:misacylated tRNA(Ala) deacylase
MKKKTDPAMHTAEHILNRAMIRMFVGCGRCFSAHIERRKSKCDYHFDHALSHYEVYEIQRRVNIVIANDLPVTESLVLKADAERFYNTEKLPDDVDGSIRIIHIGEYDACPCIGEHVTSTREIGTFKITTTSYQDGVLRIRFKLA